MITIDNKQYDETKLSETAKVALGQLQQINQKKIQLTVEFQNQEILQNHYGKILNNELPKEKTKEDKSK
jgi:hypothetical protein